MMLMLGVDQGRVDVEVAAGRSSRRLMLTIVVAGCRRDDVDDGDAPLACLGVFVVGLHTSAKKLTGTILGRKKVSG